MTELSDEEQAFLDDHRGGVWAALDGNDGAVGEAARAVGALLDGLTERYPSRTERLLLLSQISRQAETARDDLLRSILRSRFRWIERGEDDWRALAWQTWEVERLASLSGLTAPTIRRWIKDAVRETLDEAKASA